MDAPAPGTAGESPLKALRSMKSKSKNVPRDGEAEAVAAGPKPGLSLSQVATIKTKASKAKKKILFLKEDEPDEARPAARPSTRNDGIESLGFSSDDDSNPLNVDDDPSKGKNRKRTSRKDLDGSVDIDDEGAAAPPQARPFAGSGGSRNYQTLG